MRLGVALVLGLALAPAARAEITGARYADPSVAYGHGAVANGEYDTLVIETDHATYRLSHENAVFEDTAPRLVDLDGDGSAEVIAVSSGFTTGAAILIFDETADGITQRAQTDPIGRRNRWLAIAGIADLDGDGRMEIAYVDRPHLAKVLRVIEVGPGFALRDEAAASGFTNHHLGSPVIEGGIMDCGQGPEILTADADWRRVMATRLDGHALVSRDLGAYSGPASLEHCHEAEQ